MFRIRRRPEEKALGAEPTLGSGVQPDYEKPFISDRVEEIIPGSTAGLRDPRKLPKYIPGLNYDPEPDSYFDKFLYLPQENQVESQPYAPRGGGVRTSPFDPRSGGTMRTPFTPQGGGTAITTMPPVGPTSQSQPFQPRGGGIKKLDDRADQGGGASNIQWDLDKKGQPAIAYVPDHIFRDWSAWYADEEESNARGSGITSRWKNPKDYPMPNMPQEGNIIIVDNAVDGERSWMEVPKSLVDYYDSGNNSRISNSESIMPTYTEASEGGLPTNQIIEDYVNDPANKTQQDFRQQPWERGDPFYNKSMGYDTSYFDKFVGQGNDATTTGPSGPEPTGPTGPDAEPTDF